jgi:hypothetical protein
MSADPDCDVPAFLLRVGDEVEHFGQRCTVAKLDRVGTDLVHVTLSNGRSGEIPRGTRIGVYLGKGRRWGRGRR